MKSLEEIRKIINEYRPILKERFKISSIGIFGSYLREEEKKKTISIFWLSFMKPLICLNLLNLRIF